MITIDIFAVCAFVRGIRKEGPGYNCPGVLPFPFACIKYHISKVFSWKKSCELFFFKKSSQISASDEKWRGLQG